MEIVRSKEDKKKLIIGALNPLLHGKVALLDTPNHQNNGDHLIWQGELDFLKEIRRKPVYSSAVEFHRDERLDEVDTILLHGGGNFGDIYPKYHKFREHIVRKFQDKRIVIFPQTVHFSSEDLFAESMENFTSHPDLHICARDSRSKSLLDNFDGFETLMLPDMAFCSNIEPLTRRSSGRVLYLKRTDGEISDGDFEEFSSSARVETRDWPSFECSESKLKRNAWYRKINYSLSSKANFRWYLRWLVRPNCGVFNLENRRRRVSTAIRFLNQYDLVVTTRLHGFILSTIIGIPTIVLDNNYGKNSCYYQTWLRHFNKCDFANNANEVANIIEKKYPHLASCS